MTEKYKKKYAGIIPAAGLSSRMKSWKPEIIVDGYPVICHSVKTLLPFCSSLIIVGGYNFTKLESILRTWLSLEFSGECNNCIIENKKYESGMFSSVRTAACSVGNDIDGIFLLPGDIPFVKASTINSLIKEFEKDSAEVIVPSVTMHSGSDTYLRKGHPVLFNKNVLAGIKNSSEESTMRDILSAHAVQIVETDDHAICFDLDCESDLLYIEKYFSKPNG